VLNCSRHTTVVFHIHIPEGYLLPHRVHHQLSVQGECCKSACSEYLSVKPAQGCEKNINWILQISFKNVKKTEKKKKKATTKSNLKKNFFNGHMVKNTDTFFFFLFSFLEDCYCFGVTC